MPILELCAGYGGLGLAVEPLIGDSVAVVAEIDPAARRVLSERFPGVPNIGDIREYDWNRLAGQVDAITAGFPCQNISNAGRREGITGDRSRIWGNVAEAIRIIRPRHVFMENVAALRTRGLDVVAADLATLRYDLRWICLRASDVGAAHQRDRWFGYASPNNADPASVRRSEGQPQPTGTQGGPCPVRSGPPPTTHTHGAGLEVRGVQPSRAQLATAERGHPSTADPASVGHPRGGTPFEQPRVLRAAGGGRPAAGTGEENLPDPHGIGRHGRSGDEPEADGRDEPANGDYSPAGWWGDFLPAVRRWERVTAHAAPFPAETGPRGGRRLSPAFSEWLMGLEPGHVTAVPGLSRSQQLQVIGNGVVPQQAREAYRRLMS